MESVTEELVRFFKHRGWDGRIVGIERLEDLSEAIRTRHDRGLIDKQFYEECLNWLSFEPPETLPDSRSIIIIAVPVPQTRVTFHLNGEPRPAILPPTYAGYEVTIKSVQTLVRDFLAPRGYKVARTALPLKTLAVRSGLADYGRNNICYVRGMGSFLELVGCYSNLPCPRDSWREATMLERCESCVACERRCPTGAIRPERFLLHAERCLTFHNERPGDFPPWIDASAHHCLIGCMHCQSICPENKRHQTWIEDKCEFSAKETALFLKRVPFAELPATMVEKLESLELNEGFDNLSRNLSALLGNDRPALTVGGCVAANPTSREA
ncbi:MAG: 4Fe-4S double cluster binding domain-containing protein [Planctomycetota bacterium]|jgi:epoxyqueuosine reductase